MRSARATLLLPVIASLTFALSTHAEESSPVLAKPPAGQESTAPARPKRERAISDGLASSLAAGMPKYNPPPKAKPEDADIDARDVDKPRNGIIRLPKYTVQEKRPPVFTQRDVLTSQGRLDLSRKRHPGLGFGPFSRLNNGWGLVMLQEEERLENISDMKDAARTVSQSDAAEGAYIKRVTDQTYMRSSGFGYESGPGARH